MAINPAANPEIAPVYLNAADAGILPTSLAHELECALIRRTGGTLLIASAAPLSAADHERLEYILDGKVKVLVKGPEVIRATLSRYYPVDIVESGTTVVSYLIETGRSLDDGSVFIATSSVADGFFISGFVQFTPDHPEFQFWSWVIRRPEFRHRMSPRQVVGIHRIWRRFLRVSRR